MLGWLRAVRARLRRRGLVGEGQKGAHVPGRAHLVFEDGSISRAELDAGDQAKLEYLARRAVAPPPPSAD